MTDLDVMLKLLLQILAVLGTCKIVGWVGTRFLGQTQVVMEMVAGVMLGPSLLGVVAPQVQQWLFPASAIYLIDGVEKSAKHPSMFILYCLAQLGLVLYMFNIGLEFDLDLIRHRIKGAVAISLAGILAPLAFGVAIAYLTYRDGGLFKPGITLGSSALYFGAAMCITAFPMLARIIYERGMANTSLGTLALGAGATDDAVAWSLLAVVLAFSKGSASYAILAIGGAVAFALIVFKIAAPQFRRLSREVDKTGVLSQQTFVIAMFFLFLGAYTTDAIGIYAVFGAFMIGAAMPRGKFAVEIRKKTESITVGVFLPFFFVYSGLNTKLGLIDSLQMALLTAAVCFLAILGKGGACALAARLSGESWKESWAIGTLMNARGLMELIILNIGLQQGVITPRMYTIMVVMAIVTTLMASPIFQWLYNRHLKDLVPGTPVVPA